MLSKGQRTLRQYRACQPDEWLHFLKTQAVSALITDEFLAAEDDVVELTQCEVYQCRYAALYDRAFPPCREAGRSWNRSF
jgi:hypothetical protein